MDDEVSHPCREQELTRDNKKDTQGDSVEYTIYVNTNCHSNGQHPPTDLYDSET